MHITHQYELVEHCFHFPENEEYIKAWFHSVKAQQWLSLEEITETFPRAQILDDETVSFTILEDRCYIITSLKLSSEILTIRSIRNHKPVDLTVAERMVSTCH